MRNWLSVQNKMLRAGSDFHTSDDVAIAVRLRSYHVETATSEPMGVAVSVSGFCSLGTDVIGHIHSVGLQKAHVRAKHRRVDVSDVHPVSACEPRVGDQCVDVAEAPVALEAEDPQAREKLQRADVGDRVGPHLNVPQCRDRAQWASVGDRNAVGPEGPQTR